MGHDRSQGTPWQGAPPPEQDKRVMLLVYRDGRTRYVRLAGRSRRIAAALIDLVLARIPLLIIGSFYLADLIVYFDPVPGHGFIRPLLAGLLWIMLVSMAADVLCYLVVPLLAGGRTLGKMMLGLRPVRMDGYVLSRGSIVLRQLVGFRLLSMLSLGLSTIASLVMILGNDYARSLHDYLVDSVVIDERQKRSSH